LSGSSRNSRKPGQVTYRCEWQSSPVIGSRQISPFKCWSDQAARFLDKEAGHCASRLAFAYDLTRAGDYVRRGGGGEAMI